MSTWYIVFGYLAIVTTGAGPIPQVYKAYKTKKVKDVSLKRILIEIAGSLCWELYGIGLRDIPLIVTSIIVLVFETSLLVAKILYRNRKENKEKENKENKENKETETDV